MIERKTWAEFRDAKLLWWVNRKLHLFGWAIVLEMGPDGTIADAYPARVKFRGFTEQVDAEGFAGLTDHLRTNVGQLMSEVASLPHVIKDEGDEEEDLP
jgi:hypothetical protein